MLERGGPEFTGARDYHECLAGVAQYFCDFFGRSLASQSFKIIQDPHGNHVIASDGRTLIHELHYRLKNPIARCLLEAGEAQAKIHGDLSKMTIVLACKLILEGIALIRSGLHPTIVKNGFSEALHHVLREIRALAIPTVGSHSRISTLVTVVLSQVLSQPVALHLTNLLSRFLAEFVNNHLQEMVHGNLSSMHASLLRQLSIHLKPGGRILDSEILDGVVISRSPLHDLSHQIESNAGRIAMISGELYHEKRRHENFMVEFSRVDQITTFSAGIETGYSRQAGMLSSLGVKALVTERGIDERLLSAIHQLDHPVLVFRRVKREELDALARHTQGKVVHSIEELDESVLGSYETMKKMNIRGNPITIFNHDGEPRHRALIISGSVYEVCEIVKSCVMDSIRIIISSMKGILKDFPWILESMSKDLQTWGYSIPRKQSPVIHSFSQAMRYLPDMILVNLGCNPMDQDTNLLKSFEVPVCSVISMLENATKTASSFIGIDQVFMKVKKEGKK